MIKTKLEFANISSKNLARLYQADITAINKNLNDNAKNLDKFLGWIDMPSQYDKNGLFSETWNNMEKLALKLQKDIKVLVVIGIGGSYLGTRAGVEMIQGLLNPKPPVEIIYIGNTMSSTYAAQVLEYLSDKEFAINVISKSGTTIEPAIAFRLLKALLMEKQKPEVVKRRIIATTDKAKGVLHDLAQAEGYERFIIPDNIGGRYSLLTPVGIFPMMVAGIKCAEIIAGAKLAVEECKDDSLETNQAHLYAAARYHLHKTNHKMIEVLVSYELQMQMFCEWWKQLFGESEGKEGKGLFPVSVICSTDLHSMGQFLQDGTKTFFETVIKIAVPNVDIKIVQDKEDKDKLNYLTKYSLHSINNIALTGTIAAHSDKIVGKTPNILLEWATMDAKMFGYASYFFMKACAVSAMLLKVNPFNQPGVEVYKIKMFTLLGKK